MTGDEMQNEETNRQIARTNRKVTLLRDQQTKLTKIVLGLIASRDELEAPIQKKFDELSQVQQRTRKEIADLIKTINKLIKFSSGNGYSPKE